MTGLILRAGENEPRFLEKKNTLASAAMKVVLENQKKCGLRALISSRGIATFEMCRCCPDFELAAELALLALQESSVDVIFLAQDHADAGSLGTERLSPLRPIFRTG